MNAYTIQHKYNGMIKHITGHDFWHACKVNGIDCRYWAQIA